MNGHKLESSAITFKKVLDLICLRRRCSLIFSYSTRHVQVQRMGLAKTQCHRQRRLQTAYSESVSPKRNADNEDCRPCIWRAIQLRLFFLALILRLKFWLTFFWLRLQNCVQYIWVCYLSTGCRSAVFDFWFNCWFNRRVKIVVCETSYADFL